LAVVLGLILWNSGGASDPCGENPKCEAGILACSGSCRARLSLESPLFPGNGQFQPLSESLRGYVMSHFRWNQFGRKNGTEAAGMRKREGGGGSGKDEDGIPGFPGIPGEEAGKDGKRSYSMEHFRWGKPVGRKRRPVKVYPNGAEEESEENSQLEFRREEPEDDDEEEGFPRFPWNSRKEKRYGGFMSSERIRTPLVTLFKNAIGKSFAKDGQ
ncbi:COLI1 protein, partial [Aegithalos caudatus]|nr:COLI1 protein [Aegithalos caudatus]